MKNRNENAKNPQGGNEAKASLRPQTDRVLAIIQTYTGGIPKGFHELVLFGCFYKTVAVKVTQDEFPAFTKTIQGFDEQKRETIQNDKSFLFEQLEIIIHNTQIRPMTETEKVIFMMNVYHLTKFGFIKNSEYSGMILNYIKEQ